MKDLFALARHSLAGLRVLVAATVVCGVVYPLVVYGFASVAAPWQSHGSLITATGAHTTDPADAVGSALIGQQVGGPDADRLFQDRPSAAGDGYDPLSTAGSNLGPNDPRLVQLIKQRQAQISKQDGIPVSAIPPDAVTASASGLDPDISVAYAELQAPRVARANGLSEQDVRRLVAEHTAGRTWGVLGEPHVDVLELNIAVLQAARSS